MHLFKILLCGDGAVGKTSLRYRYLGGGFRKDYIKTIGADFATAEIPLSDGQICTFSVWDIAGQKEFERMRQTFYTGAAGAFILYDVTRPKTFKNVSNWVTELVLYYQSLEYFPIVLIGNKIDLREETKTVSPAEGKELAKNISMEYYKRKWTVPFLETSAKTGDRVKRAFTILGDSVVNFQKELSAKNLVDTEKTS